MPKTRNYALAYLCEDHYRPDNHLFDKCLLCQVDELRDTVFGLRLIIAYILDNGLIEEDSELHKQMARSMSYLTEEVENA